MLSLGANASRIFGTLEISAYYERGVGQVFSSRQFSARTHDTFIFDRFSIEITVDQKHRWPKVYETGLRHRLIAKRYKIPVEDLHFYPTGEACLGFSYPWDPPLTLEYFLTAIVEPFFYRLGYVDLYGLTAAQSDLWREHSHGVLGLIEYQEDVRRELCVRRSSKNQRQRARISTPR